MSLEENKYQQSYEYKENYAGEKQKQLRHGKCAECLGHVKLLGDDVM